MKTAPSGNQNASMPSTDCPTCNATVSADSRFCPECGTPLPSPEGIETRIRTYWSSPGLGLLIGLGLAGAGVVLVGFQMWLSGILALVVAALVFVLRSAVGRREAGALLTAVRARFTAHRRVVGARSRGQIELFRLRRELAELQTERSRGYQELGKATHLGDEPAADGAKERLDDVDVRINAKETEIATLVGEMEERVRQAQAEITPTALLETPAEPYPPPDEGEPPEPARVPEPSPQPVPDSSPDDPPPTPTHPPAPETKRRRASRTSNT
jgi:zinc-ribbon domain